MIMQNKTVSLITLNYNGKQYVQPLLDSLLAQTYPHIQIVMVDNASSDGSVQYVKEHYPQITLVENSENTGFTGGNNDALPHCTGEYIGLINNDMIVDPQYVERLVAALESNDADVVGGKILFYRPFVTLCLSVNTFSPADHGGSDTRQLGCKVETAIGFDGVEYSKRIFLENTFGEEAAGDRTYRWVGDQAVIKIPVEEMDTYTLRFGLAVSEQQGNEMVRMHLGDTEIFSGEVTSKFQEVAVEVDPVLVNQQKKEVLNNASSHIDEVTGSGRDVGMNEDDVGQYDEPKEVQSICGGSMLMRKELLEEHGLFDDYFFAYYEDSDFCWRMRQLGKTLFLEPRAVTHHFHTGTSKEWSPFFRYHVDRNRLAMLFKRGKWKHVAPAWGGYFAKTIKELVHAVARRMRGQNSPLNEIAWIQMKVAWNLKWHVPYLLVQRLRKR